MFFFGRHEGEAGKHPKDMTAKEMAESFTRTLNDSDYKEIFGETIDEKSKDKLAKLNILIEDIIRLDPRFKELTKDNLLAFKGGIMYGMAMVYKLAQANQGFGGGELRANELPPKLKASIRDITFIFEGIDRNYDNWDEDHWVDNLIKNAKIAEPPTK